MTTHQTLPKDRPAHRWSIRATEQRVRHLSAVDSLQLHRRPSSRRTRTVRIIAKSSRSHHEVLEEVLEDILEDVLEVVRVPVDCFGSESLSRTKFSFASSNTETPKTIARSAPRDPRSAIPFAIAIAVSPSEIELIYEETPGTFYPRALARNVVEPCLFVHEQSDQVG